MRKRRPFLSARWENLVLLQYRVPADLLLARLPRGFSLDTWDGGVFVSLVAFQFLAARVMGVRWPGHTDFPEVNLRFYVVSPDGRRGVMFVREHVPRLAISLIARAFYNEPYRTTPMGVRAVRLGGERRLRYTLGRGASAGVIEARAADAPSMPADSTLEHHFKEHEWGFGLDRGGRTLCYHVRHPVWRTLAPLAARCDINWGALYGPEWAFLSREQPASTVIAEGSGVEVDPHDRIG